MSNRKISQKTLDKYKLIIDEWFINGFNGLKAYQKFYPNASDKTSEQRFSKLSRIVKVKEYSDQKRSIAEKALRTDHEGLIIELENWAYSDITETMSLSPEQIKQLPPKVRRLITKFKSSKRNIVNSQGQIIEVIETVEISFINKEKAMEMILKHVGFYEKDNHQKTTFENMPSREERDKYIEGVNSRIDELIKKRNSSIERKANN